MHEYWDTSCLLKLYCREADSEHYLKRVETGKKALWTSSITGTELYYAFLQKERRQETGDLSARELFSDYSSDLEQGLIVHIPLGTEVYRKAREVAECCYAADSTVFLRSLDGLHLASAMVGGCKQLVTDDRRMKEAATMLGVLSS